MSKAAKFKVITLSNCIDWVEVEKVFQQLPKRPRDNKQKCEKPDWESLAWKTLSKSMRDNVHKLWSAMVTEKWKPFKEQQRRALLLVSRLNNVKDKQGRTQLIKQVADALPKISGEVDFKSIVWTRLSEQS